jgi:hypothetical protein
MPRPMAPTPDRRRAATTPAQGGGRRARHGLTAAYPADDLNADTYTTPRDLTRGRDGDASEPAVAERPTPATRAIKHRPQASDQEHGHPTGTNPLNRYVVLAFLALLAVVLVAAAAGHPVPVTAAQAATCSDFANQAAAQRARDTRDADGDGLYCETLPCPCADGKGGTTTPPTAVTHPRTSGCTLPRGTVNISFSATKYPDIRRHFLRALRAGWPRTLVLNRPGADARRDRLLARIPTRRGMDRDEYPPAVGRGKGPHLVSGSSPRGWKADVAYVPSAENRSHGSTMGIKLRRFCDGTRFRYVFY